MTTKQIAVYLIERNPNAKLWAKNYVQIYLEEGEVESVRRDVAWIQFCKKLENFAFTDGTAVTFD